MRKYLLLGLALTTASCSYFNTNIPIEERVLNACEDGGAIICYALPEDQRDKLKAFLAVESSAEGTWVAMNNPGFVGIKDLLQKRIDRELQTLPEDARVALASQSVEAVLTGCRDGLAVRGDDVG